MSNGLSQHSIATTKPVDPSIVRVLRVVSESAAALDCSFFVAGATARDLMLVNVFGLEPGRATRDIDIAIAVESWERFDLLKRKLVETGKWTTHRSAQQRLVYTDTDTNFSVPVDLIPFRGVASSDGTVAWPPHRDIVLNVAGFEEAWNSSISIEIEERFTVRVASVPGLAVLKLIAWKDRGVGNNKDATDFHRLLQAYTAAGNLDRLYNEEFDLLESVGFDLPLAGAQLLGRDCARICREMTFDQVRAIITAEELRERLAIQMNGMFGEGDSFDALERILDSFRQGFIDGTPQTFPRKS